MLCTLCIFWLFSVLNILAVSCDYTSVQAIPILKTLFTILPHTHSTPAVENSNFTLNRAQNVMCSTCVLLSLYGHPFEALYK